MRLLAFVMQLNVIKHVEHVVIYSVFVVASSWPPRGKTPETYLKHPNRSKSSEMRDCRKFGLPDRSPSTKPKKRLRAVISTKGNVASRHKCQNLRKGFPEPPRSSGSVCDQRAPPHRVIVSRMGQAPPPTPHRHLSFTVCKK